SLTNASTRLNMTVCGFAATSGESVPSHPIPVDVPSGRRRFRFSGERRGARSERRDHGELGAWVQIYSLVSNFCSRNSVELGGQGGVRCAFSWTDPREARAM